MLRDHDSLSLGSLTDGFLGVGRMGSALIRAFLSVGLMDRSQIVGTHHDARRAQELTSSLGACILTDNTEAARRSRLLFLCVRPEQLPALVQEIRDHVGAEHIVVSIAVGVPLNWLRSNFPRAEAIVHLHPSSLLIGHVSAPSFAAYEAGTCQSVVQLIESILEPIGGAVSLPEATIDIIAVIAGCAPAFLAHWLTMWEEVAAEHGVGEDLAKSVTTNIIAGIAKMSSQRKLDMIEFEKGVSTPGGVTETGLKRLEEEGLKQILCEVMSDCLNRIQRIRQGFVPKA
ncbi:MAG: NAD(P)-binding domain-containing protein [Desulfobacteraceae bacterium]|nr:NAD(P)-binding domain-containing protein [Desulfobacteraceae bacterium]